MKKQLLLICIGIALFQYAFTQIPSGYYDVAAGKSGAALKTALYDKIKGHSVQSYTPGVWNAFNTTDKKPNGRPWDIYSNKDWNFGSNQCGNYSKEGDCYNREHSFPKSWFNDASPMYSDIFHLYASDGYVNAVRGNYPFGEVENTSVVCASGSPIHCKTSNGSKRGPNTYPGYSGTVFEPVDEYKGDLARTYFYMATRYEDLIAGWESNIEGKPALNGTSFPAYDTWYLNLLFKWHAQDPVSQKEIDRNNAIYAIQGNRNPFIDRPEYAGLVWGYSTTSGVNTSVGGVNTTTGPNTTAGVNTTLGNNTSILIDQNFANCSNNGWNVVTVSGKKWNCANGYFEANGYVSTSSTAGATESWLIANPISVSGFEKVLVSFSTYTRYKDVPLANEEVAALYSTNYTGIGNPNSATWLSVPNVNYSAENSQNLLPSGQSTLSGINSSAFYLAFRYQSTGAAADKAALWRVDDVKVLGYNTSIAGTITAPNVSVPGVVVTIPANNLAPLANSFTISGIQNGNFAGSLAGNFSDPDNDNLTIISFENEKTSFGNTISINDFGDIVYTPLANFTGIDSFEYKVCDKSTCTSAIIYFNVKSEIQTLMVTKNLTLNGSIANEQQAGSFETFVGALAGGSNLVLNADGTFTFLPKPNFTGLESYTYTFCDQAQCKTGTLNFSILGVSITSTANSNSENVSLYPQPASEMLYVNVENNPIQSVSIFNIVGEKVFEIADSNTNAIEINTTTLQTGSYILLLKTSNTVISKRISIIK
ncbi:MAG: endonuclease [Cytophagales bacterium]